MRSSDKKKLLDDVLRDPNYNAFRAELFELARGEFRKGRRRGKAPLWLAVAACVAFAAIWSFWTQKPALVPGNLSATQADSAPIIPLIRTEQLQPVQIVRSVLDRSLLLETPPRAGGIEILRSSQSSVVAVTDDEMLALFADQGAGFIHADNRKQFVFFGGAGSVE